MHEPQVFNPNVFAKLTGPATFYTSVAIFQQADISHNDYGEEVPDWQNIPELFGLACRISPKSASERRSRQNIYLTSTHHLALAGWYHDITSKMQVLVDGHVYAIDGIEFDGNRQMTRVYLTKIGL